MGRELVAAAWAPPLKAPSLEREGALRGMVVSVRLESLTYAEA